MIFFITQSKAFFRKETHVLNTNIGRQNGAIGKIVYGAGVTVVALETVVINQFHRIVIRHKIL